MVEKEAIFENDYKEYMIYTKNRPHVTESGMETILKEQYELLYIFSSVIYIFKDLDERSNMWNFICETKNDLIICFDLLNMNYHTASKKILRSSIESFFRFSLSLSRYNEYKENIANNVFGATPTLKELKAMVDTHKVGRMTHYTLEYFSETDVGVLFNNLNMQYSNLSANVHVNSKSIFTPHRFLSNYSTVCEKEVKDNLEIQNSIILNILLVLYYFDLKFDTRTFGKQDLLKIESIGGEYFTQLIDGLEKIEI